VASLEGPHFDPVDYTIGEDLPIQFEKYSKSPDCLGEVKYSASLEEDPLPSFITFNPELRRFDLRSSNKDDARTYEIFVSASYENSDGSIVVNSGSSFLVEATYIAEVSSSSSSVETTISSSFSSNLGTDTSSVTQESSEGGSTPLVAEIASISASGEMVVEFSESVKVPADYSSLDEEDLLIVLEPIEGEAINQTHLAFDWNVTAFTNTKMKIQLDFTYPLEISNKVKVKLVF